MNTQATFTLATKDNKTGAVVWFGPLMSLKLASDKQATFQGLGHTVYVINTRSE
jgi:hypothetical protein